MQVIITGGTGFIGYHLANFHVSKGDKVFIIDNLFKNSGDIDKDLSVLLSNETVL